MVGLCVVFSGGGDGVCADALRLTISATLSVARVLGQINAEIFWHYKRTVVVSSLGHLLQRVEY